MPLQHPDVVQAYVVGLPDRAKGDVVAAGIELRGGALADIPAILAFCRERLAHYKVPVRLVLRSAEDLPLTSTGKIHKRTAVR